MRTLGRPEDSACRSTLSDDAVPHPSGDDEPVQTINRFNPYQRGITLLFVRTTTYASTIPKIPIAHEYTKKST